MAKMIHNAIFKTTASKADIARCYKENSIQYFSVYKESAFMIPFYCLLLRNFLIAAELERLDYKLFPPP